MSKKEEQSKPPDEIQKELEEISPLDLQYPLLKEFAEVAPGTFSHTQNLVLMVEQIGNAIELSKKKIENLKLAATFHDVGKMLSPQMFSENQKDDNLHEGLEPWISYQLITRHVSDSVMILLNNGFPVDVIQIVLEHHGDSVLKVFFAKATEQDETTERADYQYKTGKPSSIESMILMLCDVIESTTRSIYVQQGKNPDASVLITNIFNELNLDGQFNEVEIKLGNLRKIQNFLIKDTGAKYHKREPYPNNEELLEVPDGTKKGEDSK